MAEFAIKLPDRDDAIHCADETEAKDTLDAFRERNPGTLWTGVMVHELRVGSTTGLERSVFDFVDA